MVLKHSGVPECRKEFWSSGVLEFWKGVLKGIPGTIESK